MLAENGVGGRRTFCLNSEGGSAAAASILADAAARHELDLG
jgi:hypothetical protein